MKYAIVTGGARGLGLGIVRALLSDKVVGSDSHNRSRARPRHRTLRIGLKASMATLPTKRRSMPWWKQSRLNSARIPTCSATMRVAESRDGSRADGTPNGTAWRSGGAMSS